MWVGIVFVLVGCCVCQETTEILETKDNNNAKPEDIMKMMLFASGVLIALLEIIVYGMSWKKQVTIGFAEFSDNSRSEKSQPPATGTIHFQTQPHEVIVSRILGEFTDSSSSTQDHPHPTQAHSENGDNIQDAHQPSAIALRQSGLSAGN